MTFEEWLKSQHEKYRQQLIPYFMNVGWSRQEAEYLVDEIEKRMGKLLDDYMLYGEKRT